MQARFLAWLGIRSSAASLISAAKHQHSLLPWLSPQAFGSPHVGHLLGSISLAIGMAKLAPSSVHFEPLAARNWTRICSTNGGNCRSRRSLAKTRLGSRRVRDD